MMSEKWFRYISSRLGKEWKQVMLTIGLTIVDIDHIEADNPHDTIMQSTKGFLLWSNRNADVDINSKLQILYTALEETDRQDLSEELKQISFSSVSQSKKDCMETTEICSQHSQQNLEQYCKFCDMPVCDLCIDYSHRTHNIVPLTVEAEYARKDTREIAERTAHKIKHELVIKRRKLNTTKSKYNSNINVAKMLVHSRSDEMKDEIDTVRDKNIHDLETHRTNMNAKLSQLEENLNETENKFHKSREILGEISASSSDIEVIKKRKELNSIASNLNLPIFNLDSVETPEFIASESNLEDIITHSFGYCNFIRKQKLTSNACEHVNELLYDVVETRLEPVSVFKPTKYETIRNIIPSKNGKAWITVKPLKTVFLINMNGKTEKTLSVDFRINSIVESQTEELIFTTFLGLSKYPREILKLKPNGDTSKFITADKLIPCFLSVSRTGHIFASMVDSYSFDLTSASVRIVRKFKENGLYVCEYRLNEKGEHLFNQPYTVLEHQNGDLWVKNRFELVAGNIVVLEEMGKHKFQYCGLSTPKLKESFFPGDLCSLPNNNIIVSDTYNNILHVVDSAGTLLQFLNSQSPNGLRLPSCVRIDSDGFLWVGSLDGSIKILKQV